MACPYQVKAPVNRNGRFRFNPDMGRFDLREVIDMDAGAFEVRFADSVIKRLGLERLKRNALICLENSSG